MAQAVERQVEKERDVDGTNSETCCYGPCAVCGWRRVSIVCKKVSSRLQIMERFFSVVDGRITLFFLLSSRLEILRDAGTLLRIVARVFDPRVPPRRDVADDRLRDPVGRAARAIGVRVAVTVLVVILGASAVSTGALAGSVGPACSAIRGRRIGGAAVDVGAVGGRRRAHGSEDLALGRLRSVVHQRLSRAGIGEVSSCRRGGVGVSCSSGSSRHGCRCLPAG